MLRATLLVIALLLAPLPLAAHPGDGDTTIVVTVTVAADGEWRAEILLDGRIFVQRLPAALWSEGERRALDAALADDLSTADQRDALLRAFATKVRLVVDGEREPVDILSVGPDPQLAAYDDLPDHRWGRLVVGGRIEVGTEQLQLEVWPFILPASFEVHLPQHAEAITQFVAWREDGRSDPVPLTGVVTPQGAWPILSWFTVSGWQHVLPDGLDHLLFILGLALFSQRLGPLVLQLSMFTLAHTLTLGLVAWGLVRVPAAIVEPIIALSIAVVALENCREQRLRWWRLPVIIVFGLVHGLGFGGAFTAQTLPGDQALLALLGFNLGVELAQIAVVVVLWLICAAIGRAAAHHPARAEAPAAAITAAIAYGAAAMLGAEGPLLAAAAATGAAAALAGRAGSAELGWRRALLVRPASALIAAAGLLLALLRVIGI